MKVWVTKYALTAGIEEIDHARVSEVSPRMIIIGGNIFRRVVHKPFWHTTRESAVEHANQIRLRKLKSLQKQIEKLNKPIE